MCVCVCVFAVHRLDAEGRRGSSKEQQKAASCVDAVVVQKGAGELCRMMPQREEPKDCLGLNGGSPFGVVKNNNARVTRGKAHPKSSCPKEKYQWLALEASKVKNDKGTPPAESTRRYDWLSRVVG